MRGDTLLWGTVFLGLLEQSTQRISPGFTHCPDHFYKSFIPTVTTLYTGTPDNLQIEAKDICQQFASTNHFASRYDTRRKTPIFSAYHEGPNTPRTGDRSDEWRYEPGLIKQDKLSNWEWVTFRNKDGWRWKGTKEGKWLGQDTDDVHNMQSLKWNDDDSEAVRSAIGENMPITKTKSKGGKNPIQDHSYHYRLNPDLINIGEGREPQPYDIGHLLPSSYATNPDFREATNAITNTAPQDPALNRIKWEEAEQDMKALMEDNCENGDKYFLIGTALKKNKAQEDLLPPPWAHPEDQSGVIVVPDGWWTVACCINPDPTQSFGLGYYSTSNDNIADVKWDAVQAIEDILGGVYSTYKETMTTSQYRTKGQIHKLFDGIYGEGCYKFDGGKGKEYVDRKKAEEEAMEIYKEKQDEYLEGLLKAGNRQIMVYQAVEIHGMNKKRKRKTEDNPDLTHCMSDCADQLIAKQFKRDKRKKRSVDQEPEFQLATFLIEDSDPESTFIIDKVTFTETYANESISEKHSYDFKNNVLIEDKKDGGSELEARAWENNEQAETETKENEMKTITIILKPH